GSAPAWTARVSKARSGGRSSTGIRRIIADASGLLGVRECLRKAGRAADRRMPGRQAPRQPVLVRPRPGCLDPDQAGRLEAESRVVRGVAEQAEQGLAALRGELDGGVDERAADALPLVVRDDRDRA